HQGRGGQPRQEACAAGRHRRPRVPDFQARSLRAADPMTDAPAHAPRRRPAFGRKLVVLVPALWLLLFFVVPCLIVLKISLSQTVIAQPPYAPVLDLSEGLKGVEDFVSGLSVESYKLLGSDTLYIVSYVRSLMVAALST